MVVVKKSISLPTSMMKAIEDFVPRMPETTELSTKISEMIEDLSAELQRTKREIAPLFTESEWSYLRDAFNGTVTRPDFHPVTMLKAQVEDADGYNGLGEKWEVDVSALLEKVKTLTSFQGYTVLKSIQEWWKKQV